MHPLFRLLSYMRPHRRTYLLGTVYSLLNKAFDIAPEILIGVAIDVVVKQKSSWLAELGIVDIKPQLVTLGVLTFAIWGCESIFQYLYALKWRNLAQIVQHQLRMDACTHVQRLDQKTFETFQTGKLTSILNDDINQLERFLGDGVNQIIQIFFSTVVIGCIFFLLAPSIALYAILPIPLIIIGSFFFQDKLAPRFLAVREKASDIANLLNNNLTGILTIKGFCAEKEELRKIKQSSEAYSEANRHAIKWSALIVPVIRIAVLIGFLATLVYGGFLAIEGELNVGVYGILVFLTQRLLWPLTLLAEMTDNYQRSMASATRVLDLLETPISIDHGTERLPPKKKGSGIFFDGVSFGYDPKHLVLKDFSTNIPAGKTVAFVGTTGSGKSTLIKLLLRFYEPNQGIISIDDYPIQTLHLSSLRRATALVSQETFLFHGTVEENIRYPDRHAAHEEVVQAAKLAEADRFIKELPEGYQTVIGERGQKLSGGQRQRIALARALIKNPPILLLDEATSAVDNETEMLIQKSLEYIVKGRTVVMIAHRLSTVRHADTIHVMKHGAIVESGTHEELLGLDKMYATLWRLQTGEEYDERFLQNGV